MGVIDGMGKISQQKKRARRSWVLEECIRRGMDLRTNFNAYDYELKMYPAIKGITQSAPLEWDWDRSVTRDVIRTLCWDRVRNENRRIKTDSETKVTKPSKAAKPVAVTNPTHAKLSNSKPKHRTHHVSDEEEVLPPPRPPKTISRAPIPAVQAKHDNTTPYSEDEQVPKHSSRSKHVQIPETIVGGKISKKASSAGSKRAATLAPKKTLSTSTRRVAIPTSPAEDVFSLKDVSSPESQNAQRVPGIHLDMDDNTTFSVIVGNKSIAFAKDIEYEEFDSAVECHLQVGSGEMRFYRPITGTKREREWKPLGYPIELVTLIRKFGDIGVELTVKDEVN